jgi:hypothetical protein
MRNSTGTAKRRQVTPTDSESDALTTPTAWIFADEKRRPSQAIPLVYWLYRETPIDSETPKPSGLEQLASDAHEACSCPYIVSIDRPVCHE